jgi:hypothetical protein
MPKHPADVALEQVVLDPEATEERHPAVEALGLAIEELRASSERLGLSRRALDIFKDKAPADVRRDVRRYEKVLEAIGYLKGMRNRLEKDGRYILEEPPEEK